MTNYGDYALIMSQMYLEMVDTNTVSAEHLTQFKNMLPDLEASGNPDDGPLRGLINFVELYAVTAVKTIGKDKVLTNCTGILNSINSTVCPVNVDFRLKMLEFMLCGNLTPVSEIISILKDSITKSDTESINDRIRCRAALLDVYLSNPNDNLDNIRSLSDELKPLIALRDAQIATI